MSISLPRPLRRVIIATSVVALIAAPIWTRGLGAAASPSVAIPSVDARVMSARIAELERRIAELEAATNGAGRADHARTLAPSTVTAPFVVVDGNGKTLMRVDRFARLTIGDSSGSRAVLSATPESGVLQLIDATDKVRLTAAASKNRIGVTTFLREGTTFMGGNEDGLPAFQARNLGDIPVAELRVATAHSGQLFLTNEAGTKLVAAGMSTEGVGIIKLGPNGNGAAAVMGNNALPASEIRGKKQH